MTDDELRAAIREAYPVFQAKVLSGAIVVRGSLTYAKKGPSLGGLPAALAAGEQRWKAFGAELLKRPLGSEAGSDRE